MTERLAWPITGHPPRALRHTKTRPLTLPMGYTDSFADQLRTAVDHTPAGQAGTMLQRQVTYLLADHPPTIPGMVLRTRLSATPVRRPAQVTPERPVVRWQAVSAAIKGDSDPLIRFIRDGLVTDEEIRANLNYWAYWGESHKP